MQSPLSCRHAKRRGSVAGYKAKVATHLEDQDSGHFKATQGSCPTVEEARYARSDGNERVDRHPYPRQWDNRQKK